MAERKREMRKSSSSGGGGVVAGHHQNAAAASVQRSGRPTTTTADSESYSSNSSYTDASSYSDSSDLANWEEFVADNGSLFYAEYLPQVRKSNAATATAAAVANASTNTNSRSSAGGRPGGGSEPTKSSAWRVGKKLIGVASAHNNSNTNNNSNTATIGSGVAVTRRHHQVQQQKQQQQQHKKHTHAAPPPSGLLEPPEEKGNAELVAATAAAAHKFTLIQPAESATIVAAAAVSKQLELVITSADRYRFGRRSTPTESILGFRVAPYADRPDCLMVVDFVHDMPAMQQQQQTSSAAADRENDGGLAQAPIQRGDWFRSLDDIEVRASNVNELLLQFTEPTKVRLRFQGPAVQPAAASTSSSGAAEAAQRSGGSREWQTIENFNMFATVFEQLLLPAKGEVTTTTAPGETPATPPPPAMPFGLLILPPECYQLDEHKDSLYFYPEDAALNFLYKTRGSFLTLHAVLSKELRTQPHTSRLSVDGTPYYVTYRTHNSLLVLCAYAEHYQSLAESGLRTDELLAYLRFTMPALTHQQLAIGSGETAAVRQHLRHFGEVQRTRLLAAHRRCPVQFEELLRESRSLALPKEAQLRIYDALSEMEAMDYRNWNAEPLRTHREFFMHGSALYCDHWLLTAQLPVEVRAHVDAFLRCTGIFDLMAAETARVRELCVWQEISLAALDTDTSLSGGAGGAQANGRYFLCVCSRGHLLLAVVLRLFDATDLLPGARIPPSLFYIEEIQETLEHLVQCGIESLALFWSVSNKRPEVWSRLDTLGEGPAKTSVVGGAAAGGGEHNKDKEGSRLETFIKQKLTPGSASAGHCDEEVHLCSSIGGSSVLSATLSEEDLNRRRLNAANNNASTNNSGTNPDDSDSGGSDWEHFGEQLPGIGGATGASADAESHITESLNNLLPINISGGGAWKNALFHYVCVDYANGTVSCPLRANADAFPYMADMRRAFHAVRDMLQRTRLARREADREGGVGVGPAAGDGKDMKSIKEYGITVAVNDKATPAAGASGANNQFNVVGRLFTRPLKEVYICHHPDVPQNMVEIAFRLSFFPAG